MIVIFNLRSLCRCVRPFPCSPIPGPHPHCSAWRQELLTQKSLGTDIVTGEKETRDRVYDRSSEKYIELGQISWELKSKTGSSQVWAEAPGLNLKRPEHSPSPWQERMEPENIIPKQSLGEQKEKGFGSQSELSLRIQVN